MTNQEKKLALSLIEDIRKLRLALSGYHYSYAKCLDITPKEERSADEEVEFEALTARFALLADLLTQRLHKALFILLKEDLPTFIDRANYAEKLGLVSSSQTLRVIRELRNRIAHEYEEDDILEIHGLLFDLHADFIQSINGSIEYTVKMLRQLGMTEEE